MTGPAGWPWRRVLRANKRRVHQFPNPQITLIRGASLRAADNRAQNSNPARNLT
jgi:hypothetical protein